MIAVSNASRLYAEMLLSGLGITHRLKTVVIGDELFAWEAASNAKLGGAGYGTGN